MCKFFSFCTDEVGKKYYFNWEQRQNMAMKDGEDSHDHIQHYYNLKNANCYEYNPLTANFVVDTIQNGVDDRIQAEEWVKRLDFKKVVKPLIVKPIVMPLAGKAKKPTPQNIADLKAWASVRASVRASVWASVGDSVWALVGAYISSFLDIEYKIDISPAIRLWEAGFLPSYDGATWRLYSGKSGKIVFKWTQP